MDAQAYQCLLPIIWPAFEMTYIVSGGALNSTHSLTHSLTHPSFDSQFNSADSAGTPHLSASHIGEWQCWWGMTGVWWRVASRMQRLRIVLERRRRLAFTCS